MAKVLFVDGLGKHEEAFPEINNYCQENIHVMITVE